jgi:hypothetical protein
LKVKDFELLVSLDLFNSSKMNEAVFGFKRYEDASLGYTGINKHEREDVGGYDTVLTRKEFEETFTNISPWYAKSSKYVTDNLGKDKKWISINSTMSQMVEENNYSFLDLNDLDIIAKSAKSELKDVFSVVGLLSNPDKNLMKVEFSTNGDNEKIDSQQVYMKLREYWKDKKLSENEWEKWSKMIQVKWKINKTEHDRE